MNSDVFIRDAVPSDAEKILSVYAPYITQTAITFEYEIPTLGEFKKRIEKTLENYPYLAAEKEGQIIGYAYASRINQRKACDRSVEVSIYIRQDQKRTGVGRMLYTELEKRLKQLDIISMYAGIAYAERCDEHLTCDSVEFHKKWGSLLPESSICAGINSINGTACCGWKSN